MANGSGEKPPKPQSRLLKRQDERAKRAGLPSRRAALASVPSAKPHRIQDVIQRVEQGTSTKADAAYLLDTLALASLRIRALEHRVAMLQRRLATVH